FSLRALESPDPRTQSEHDLHHWSGPWRPRSGCEHLSGGIVLGNLSAHRAEPGRDQTAIPAIQLAVWDSEPRCSGDAGFHPRGWRVGLLARTRLRSGVRQSEPDRELRGG